MIEIFKTKTNKELCELYKDYQNWMHEGYIETGCKLDPIRNEYVKTFSYSALQIMELDFLREIAKRHFKE